MRPNLITLLLLIACSFQGYAQQEQHNSKYSLSFGAEPLFLFNNSIKFNVIAGLNGKRSSFDLSPEIYFGKQYDRNETNDNTALPRDSYSGVGVGLHHRVHFAGKKGAPYIMYGATYRRINVTYRDEGFAAYQQNGLSYYEYGLFTDQLKINSLLIDGGAGVKVFDTGSLWGEAYAGLGYKISNKKSGMQGYRDYDKFFTSYAYQGAMLLVGFKLGFHVIK